MSTPLNSQNQTIRIPATEHNPGGTLMLDLASNVAEILDTQGKRYKLAISPGESYDPAALPTYLAGYPVADHRADEMSPVLFTDHETVKPTTFGIDYSYQRVDVKMHPDATPRQIKNVPTVGNVPLIYRGIGAYISRQTEWHTTNDSPFKPRRAMARRCKNVISLDREIDVITMLSTAGNWHASVVTTLAATFQWYTVATGLEGSASNPIRDLQEMYNDSGSPIDTFWMNQNVANAFLAHSKVQSHMRMVVGDAGVAAIGSAMASALKTNSRYDLQIPGVGTIKVSSARVLNDTTGLLEYIMPNVVIAVRSPSAPTDGEDISTTYTWRMNGLAGVGYEVREHVLETQGLFGGTLLVVASADVAVMTGNRAGGLLLAVIQ